MNKFCSVFSQLLQLFFRIEFQQNFSGRGHSLSGENFPQRDAGSRLQRRWVLMSLSSSLVPLSAFIIAVPSSLVSPLFLNRSVKDFP
jgi:hypothetical protein